MSLKQYQAKRKFGKTPEPPPKVAKSGAGELKFVIQLHAASRLHYDFRLELDGVMKSWAVPKGPSLDPTERRLAVQVEDHPMDYNTFEGIIPKGNYGAGTVIIWDVGTYWAKGYRNDRKKSEEILRKGLATGDFKFCLEGTKIQGEFALVKIKSSPDKAWLLLKKRDGFHSNKAEELDSTTAVSAITGRTLKEVASASAARGDVWLPKKGRVAPTTKKEAHTKITKRGKKKILAASVPKLLAKAPAGTPPKFIKVAMPTTAKSAPKKGKYIYEPAWEGYRAIGSVVGGKSRLYSKGRVAFDTKFAKINAALIATKHDLTVDGTIVLLNADGSPRQKGYADNETATKGAYRYYINDLLYIDGRDLTQLALDERLAILHSLGLEKKSDLLRIVENVPAFDDVDATGTNALYALARSSDGEHLRIRLADGLGVLEAPPPAEQTPRTKKSPVTKKLGDRPVPFVAASNLKFVPSNLNKIFWPEEKYTKGDLLAYYQAVAPYMLPHIQDRAQSLNRHPNGIEGKSFFQKETTGQVPKWMQSKIIQSGSTGKATSYAVCQDVSSLLFVVNMGCIEINVWNSRIQKIECPDYVVFDLDPGNIPFRHTVEATLEVKNVLDQIGLEGFCKTTGGRGLHIYVPIIPNCTHDEVREFAEAVSRVVHQKLPKTTSIDRNPALRSKLIYLDFLQNRRGSTMAAPYCVRPRPHALVSTPLRWEEVTPSLSPESFTMMAVLSRVEQFGDLWADLYSTPADLKKALKKLR